MSTPARLEAFALACNSINWACAGKDPFETKDRALKVIDKMRRSRTKKRAGAPITAYRCPYCKAWHVGSAA